MEIHDRDNKKRTAMMLPEHVAELDKLRYEQFFEVEKPELETDKLEELNYVIQRSLEHYEPLTISYYKDKRIHFIRGVVVRFDATSESIRLQEDEVIHNISIQDVIDATT